MCFDDEFNFSLSLPDVFNSAVALPSSLLCSCCVLAFLEVLMSISSLKTDGVPALYVAVPGK